MATVHSARDFEQSRFLCELQNSNCWIGLERISNESLWQPIKSFIEQYGHELFTQSFLQFDNLRAILYHGVESWLDELHATSTTRETNDETSSLASVQNDSSRKQLAKSLRLVIEGVVNRRLRKICHGLGEG